jgi:hypothetical protein
MREVSLGAHFVRDSLKKKERKGVQERKQEREVSLGAHFVRASVSS